MKMKSLIFAVVMAASSFAAATTPEYIELLRPRIEIDFAVGMAQQTGYLTTEKSVGSYVIGVNMEAATGLMTFEWNGFSIKHDTPEFALGANKDTRISTFSFIPQIRVLDKEAWNAFVGLGLAQVGIYQADPEYYVNYGTFILSGMLRYRINEKWSAHFKSQWYGVRQSINAQETGFEVWNNVLGLGYHL